MKNKKWLLLLIILLPSLFWVILETSTINSYKLFHYGPKTTLSAGDTSYYKIAPVEFYSPVEKNPVTINENDFPLYIISFIKNEYKTESFRIAGLWEYANYKKEKIEHIPFFLVTQESDGKSETYDSLKTLSAEKIKFLTLPSEKFDSLNKIYFKEKPVHIDYSFFALIDANRNIRGYYDGRYAAEIKRLIDEYKHLRLKEEKEKLLKSNEIKSN